MNTRTRDEAAALAAGLESAAEDDPRPTVLAVDDTPAQLSLTASLLQPHWRVQLAVSGHKALELAQRRAPDLVLLDVMMPGLDGYAVCRRLKADPRTADVPVIVLTALARAEDEIAAFEAGAADHVIKPFTPAALVARVRAQLALKAAQDRLRDHNAALAGELAMRRREVEALRDTKLQPRVGRARHD